MLQRVLILIVLPLAIICWTLSIVNALECYSCDSAEDAECATRPGQQINVEECARENDECVTVIVAGITRRGCLSRLYPNNYCAAPCDRCNISLCNRNIFPEDRLRCYQCVGASCIDVRDKNSLILPCPIYNEKDRCYTNVIGISNVQRGCEYTNLPASCPHVCLKCNYNGCNNELGVHEESCLECTHNANNPNPNCLRNQQPTAGSCRISIDKRCTNKLLHGHIGKCFSYINEQTGVVQRGCSTTMGFFPTGTLSECYGDDCNRECLAIACNNCSTADEAIGHSCRSGHISLRPQKCGSADTFACYSCEQGGHLRRGCVDDKFVPALEEACYECREKDGCNRMPIRTCYRCSSLDDVNCGEWSDERRIARNNCTGPYDLCVSTTINRLNLVYTVRGCASQVPECTINDPFCVRCNGSLCNSGRLPWKREEKVKLLEFQSGDYQQLEVARSSGEAGRNMWNFGVVLSFTLAVRFGEYLCC